MINTFLNARTLNATPVEIFSAIKDPARLAKWWGPKGFTNRFDVFEFKEGGQWVFDMIDDAGEVYPNQSIFLTIEENRQVVIRHDCQPYFTLTILLTPTGDGTEVRWTQVFDDATIAQVIQHIIEPANEQNLDKLSALVSRDDKKTSCIKSNNG